VTGHNSLDEEDDITELKKAILHFYTKPLFSYDWWLGRVRLGRKMSGWVGIAEGNIRSDKTKWFLPL